MANAIPLIQMPIFSKSPTLQFSRLLTLVPTSGRVHEVELTFAGTLEQSG